MVKLKELGKKQELFEEMPADKMRVFSSPTLWLASGNVLLHSWPNTQPFYFYPFSVLDFLNNNRRELRIIDSSRTAAIEAIKKLKGSKVHFEGLKPDLIDFALKSGHKVSVICDLEEINPSNLETLSCIDFLIVRINSANQDLSRLKGIPNKRLLSGIRVYLSSDSNDFTSSAKEAKRLGFDFIHVSKRLVGSRQASFPESQKDRIHNLLGFQSKTFKVLLPKNLNTVFNEKFAISDEYDNSSNCYFSRFRRVLYKDKFYPCYTHSIVEKGKFSSETLTGLRKKSKLFGKGCTDCACIYENDLFEDISKSSKRIKNKRFLLGYDY